MAGKAAVKDDKQLDLVEKIEEVKVDENLDQPIEIEVGEVAEPQKEEATLQLEKLLEDTRKSEKIQKERAERLSHESEENKRLAEASRAETNKTRKEALQSNYDAVATALTSYNSEAERAQADIETFGNIQDWKSLAEAQRRLSRAEAGIIKLEDNKRELDARLKEPDPVRQDTLPPIVKNWIDRHQHLMNDPEKRADLQYFHRLAIREGIELYSPEYIDFIEVKAGLKQAEVDVKEPVKEPERVTPKTSIVSAPVSREATTSTGGSPGTIRLSPQQREAAKIAGVSEKVYAEQLIQINKMKANGTYGG